MKRWMVVAAMGLAAIGAVVLPGAARASSSAWYQAYQVNASGGFQGIAAISKGNIWAVGDTSKAGKTVYQPFVRHFNGTAWQAITIPGSAGSTSDWVTASAANNVWVGGSNDNAVETYAVYRWNGARWGKIPMPALTSLEGIAVLAPNNAWAIGSSATIYDEVFHWNGAKWQGYLSNTLNFVVQGISASSAGNIWVSGYAFSGSKQVACAYRWNGSAWHAVSMPHPVVSDGGPSVEALSPSNVWLGYGLGTASRALHWDGVHWHIMSAPYYANVSDVVPDGKGGYWFGAQAILTGSTWAPEQVPGFTGGFGGPVRIPGTTSFLLNAGVETGTSSTEKPTIFRFDL